MISGWGALTYRARAVITAKFDAKARRRNAAKGMEGDGDAIIVHFRLGRADIGLKRTIFTLPFSVSLRLCAIAPSRQIFYGAPRPTPMYSNPRRRIFAASSAFLPS